MSKNTFKFFTPLDIVKAVEGKKQEYRIAGYASTSDEDRQGDTIIQKGLDFSDFVDHGYINFDHESDKIVGYPDKAKCKLDSHGFYVEALLIPEIPLAKSIWDTAVALAKSNAPRKLGFSIEGKVLKRNELGQIVKAKIYNVAATYNPVNVNCTFEALCKSFTDNEEEIDKALNAGHGDGSGTPLIPEDLETSLKNISLVVGEDEETKKRKKALKEQLETANRLNKSELITYLQLVKGLSYKDANNIIKNYTDSKEEKED